MALKIPVPAKDLYSAYDSEINPTYLAAILFEETISKHYDTRFYSDEALKLLEKEGEIIQKTTIKAYDEGLSKEEKLKKASYDADEDSFGWHYDEKRTTRYFLYKKTIVQQTKEDTNKNVLTWFYAASQTLELGEFEEYLVPEDEKAAKIGLLMLNSSGNLLIKSIDFKAPVFAEDNILLNYGDKFGPIYKKILDRLENMSKGILIFRGDPGTGKSYLIKHLTSKIDREFIFIPTGLSGELASPSFLTLLLNHKNSVLVLEDAEQAIQSREDNLSNASTVSTLLNLADGLLSDLLNITLILSYNTGNERVDKGLLRKGRLGLDYLFPPLSIKEGQRLADSLKKNIKIEKEMILADVYNIEVDTNRVEIVKPRMGFGA